MAEHDDARPPTAAECMDVVAGYLDAADEFIRLVTANTDRPLDMGDGVQRDLRRLAGWLREHPEVDAQVHAAMEARR